MKACHSAVLRDAEGKEGMATPSACHEHTLTCQKEDGSRGRQRAKQTVMFQKTNMINLG